jgi:cardiolipin synthase
VIDLCRGVPFPAALIVLAASCASCVGVGQRDVSAAPVVTVVGAQGLLPTAAADAVVARAAADAPDPQAIERLESLMQTVSPEPLYKDNSVRLLVDGPATYVAMLEAIDAARRHIHLETYIFNEDEIGRRFADALMSKSRAGLEVRVIFDSLGSRSSSTEFFDDMKSAGIGVVEFHPVNPAKGGNPLNLNARDHRKLLVIDGAVAFTGGLNLDRNYASGSRARRRANAGAAGWRDTHVELRGPAVAGFQRLFLKNWKEEGGSALGDESRFFPRLQAHGTHLVRVLSATGGDGEVSPIRIAYGLAMDAASRRIWITQSYFGPDPDFLRTMREAAARGVDVRIIVTGVSDAPLLLNVSRSCYEDLLKAGVRIYESPAVMLHAKTAVIDGVWSTVGSSNLDYRSFIHNYEVNAAIVGRDFGAEMERLFRDDMAHSREITPEQWERRSLLERIKEALSSVFQYWL